MCECSLSGSIEPVTHQLHKVAFGPQSRRKRSLGYNSEAAATVVLITLLTTQGTDASVAATVQLLGRQSYAFDKRRRLDKRGHLQTLVVEVNRKIKRTVSDVPSCDQAIFDP